MTETSSTTKQKKQRSYFKQSTLTRYVLDDGESYIEHKKLDEGLFQRYQDITSKIKIDRDGESSEVDMALGKQRAFLLENLVEGWNLLDENEKPVKFSPARLLELPPEIIGGLIQDIYENNPILQRGDDEDDEGKD